MRVTQVVTGAIAMGVMAISQAHPLIQPSHGTQKDRPVIIDATGVQLGETHQIHAPKRDWSSMGNIMKRGEKLDQKDIDRAREIYHQLLVNHRAIAEPQLPNELNFPDPLIPTKDPQLLTFYQSSLQDYKNEMRKPQHVLDIEEGERLVAITEWDQVNACIVDGDFCTLGNFFYKHVAIGSAVTHHATYLTYVREQERLGRVAVGSMLTELMAQGIPLEE